MPEFLQMPFAEVPLDIQEEIFSKKSSQKSDTRKLISEAFRVGMITDLGPTQRRVIEYYLEKKEKPYTHAQIAELFDPPKSPGTVGKVISRVLRKLQNAKDFPPSSLPEFTEASKRPKCFGIGSLGGLRLPPPLGVTLGSRR